MRQRPLQSDWEMHRFLMFFNKEGQVSRAYSESDFLIAETSQIQTEEAITKLPHVNELKAFCAAHNWAPLVLTMDDVGRL